MRTAVTIMIEYHAGLAEDTLDCLVDSLANPASGVKKIRAQEIPDGPDDRRPVRFLSRELEPGGHTLHVQRAL